MISTSNIIKSKRVLNNSHYVYRCFLLRLSKPKWIDPKKNPNISQMTQPGHPTWAARPSRFWREPGPPWDRFPWRFAHHPTACSEIHLGPSRTWQNQSHDATVSATLNGLFNKGILREIILKHTVYTNIHQLIVEVSSKCFFLSLKQFLGMMTRYDMHREKLQHWKRTWRKIAQGWLT